MEAALPALPSVRECGECALCCRLGEIPDFKPYNAWCHQCSTGKGCDAYDIRPQPCRSFFCHYLGSDIGEHWRPLVSHMVVSAYADPPRILISVDPEMPLIWREAPYLAEIMGWSGASLVIVMVGLWAWAVYPDRLDALGEISEAHTIITVEQQSAQGFMRLSRRVLKSESQAGMAELQSAMRGAVLPSSA